ncbi:sensor histidine kinase [Cereibacter sphaeroides]|uniref:sensor histidine kinase n=3 Tax=Cereibacter sphaeroides TaxID=1063 RepID=UPI001F3241A8|nr:sensor histidine kinase [Cereibacter sphaeroides]MCE6951384.1 sensor histidine kinase [Cereibacter sphaeroides]MCE6960709.1 sensor histidine kinase [Cereibacter sphaeroides]MCE6970025.1 sensor histidine kinase [Cereibacter sphaeroides]
MRWSVPRSARFQIVFSVAAIAISTALRFGVDFVLPPGFPFLTYFPAIILTAFFAGPRSGAAVAVATGLFAWFFFVVPPGAAGGAPAATIAMLFFALIAGTDILLIHVMKVALRRMVDAEARSSALAASRSLMFNELQHRVSNNIGTVGSLLRLQERRMTDPKARAALADARARLEVVARLQRRLHDPARQSVDMGEFIRGLAQDTIEAMDAGQRIACLYELEPFVSEPDQAMPLGLVTSELLMNACEHGIPAESEGLIAIRLARLSDRAMVRLAIEDDGRGVPDGFSPGEAGSLGLSIAAQFAHQLGGRLTVRRRPQGGTVAELVFPEAGPAARPAPAAAPQPHETV